MNDATAFRAGVVWKLTHPLATIDHLGMLPLWFNAADERPALEQADSGYKNTAGCGYHPQAGFTLKQNEKGSYALQYGSGEPDEDGDPADPPLEELARAELREELIVLFDAEYVAIIQKDQTFVAARCD
jgi:hypothetical protein